MPFYFDESIHDRARFLLGAYVYGPDPTPEVDAALRSVGLRPEVDEFKSSARMSAAARYRVLREDLHSILRSTYRYGVVIAPSDGRSMFGREALLGLAKIAEANGLTSPRQTAYFDQGIFPAPATGSRLAEQLGVARFCDVRFEQDSRLVRGLQLADLVAHTCSTMLLDTLGFVQKLVKAGPNSGYDPDLDIELGFELWASVRWQFFNGGLPRDIQSNDDIVVNVEDYGLYVAESCPLELREAAIARFGRQYLGCIH